MAMRAVAVDPTHTFNRAVSAYKAGRLGDAEHLCQQILSAQPGHFDAAHVLAAVQASRGRNDLALASYDRALVARPDFPEAFCNRGSAFETLQRRDEALASYDRALTLRPAYAGALYNRGNVKKAVERYSDALADYDRALTLRPQYADAHNNRGQILKALPPFCRCWIPVQRLSACKRAFARMTRLFSTNAAISSMPAASSPIFPIPRRWYRSWTLSSPSIPVSRAARGGCGQADHEFTPAPIFSLNSAIAEIVWLVSGRSTGSPMSADRSAAL
jgi:tetratricopeptide (TPR) repeat protein